MRSTDLAYSMLLAGSVRRTWRDCRGVPDRREHRQAAEGPAADLEGHSAAAELGEPGRLRAAPLCRCVKFGSGKIGVLAVTYVIVPKPSRMYQIRGSESSEVAMKDHLADLDKIDEAHMTYDLSDEALEAAARVDGGRAITIGACATASTSWYCLPY